MYSCVISDILTRFADLQDCFILGDVTYGACCVDDFAASALGCDFLVHYGHSCLVPVDITKIKCLYVFVTIEIDVDHLVRTIEKNFPSTDHIALAGTIQFSLAIHSAKSRLIDHYDKITVPQSRPLSAGEVLGCTAPKLDDSTSALVFVADGRFHLEAIMIVNPSVPAYRYDPYSRSLVREQYIHSEMRKQRQLAIEEAKKADTWGVILGSLGRQGKPALARKLTDILEDREKTVISFVMSEILPSKVSMIKHIDAWVQVGCPRLSIDWGSEFRTPVLTPYETMIAMEEVEAFWLNGDYPMDYYAKESGDWSSSYHKRKKD